MVIKTTKKIFEDEVSSLETEFKFKGKTPCLVKFGAQWCSPCRMIEPVLEELAEEYKDKIKIYDVDTEEEQELAAAFGIQSIPSLLFIPFDGQPQMAMGAMPKAGFEKIFKDLFSI